MLKKSVVSLIIASHCLTILPVYAGPNDFLAYQKQERKTLTKKAHHNGKQLVSFEKQRKDTLADPKLLTFAIFLSLLRPGETASTGPRRQDPNRPIDSLLPYPVITTDKTTGVITGTVAYFNVPYSALEQFLEENSGTCFSARTTRDRPRESFISHFENLRQTTHKKYFDFSYLEGIRGSNDIFPANQNATYSFLDFQAPAVAKVDAKGQQTLTAQLGSINLTHTEFQGMFKASSGDFLAGVYRENSTTFALQHNRRQVVFPEMSGNKLHQTGAFMTCLSETALEENVKNWDCVKNIDSLKPISPPDFSLLRNGSSTPSPSSPDIAPRSNFGDSGDVAADLTTLFSPSQSEVTSAFALTQDARVSPVHVTYNISHANNTFGLDMMSIGYIAGGVIGCGLGVAALTCVVKKCTQKNRPSGSKSGGKSGSGELPLSQSLVLNMYKGEPPHQTVFDSSGLRTVILHDDKPVVEAPQGQGSQMKSCWGSQSSYEMPITTVRKPQPLPNQAPIYAEVNESTQRNLGQHSGSSEMLFSEITYATLISFSEDKVSTHLQPYENVVSWGNPTLPCPSVEAPQYPAPAFPPEEYVVMSPILSPTCLTQTESDAVPTNNPVTQPVVTGGEGKAQPPASPVLNSGKKVRAAQSFTRPLPKPPVSGH